MPETERNTAPGAHPGLSRAIAAVLSIALACTLLMAGLAVDCAPATTRALSSATSDFDRSPYAADSLVDLAAATRDFTVEPFWDGEDAAARRLAGKVVSAASIAQASGMATGGRWSRVNVDLANPDVLQAMYDLAAVSDAYGLDEEAMDHLVDCNALINRALVAAVAIAALAVGCTLALRGNRRLLGDALIAGPALLLAAMALCGIWAALDFYGFFSMFHAILFPQGNWTFSRDSLLICMLPEGFWMGMGAIWLAVTATAAIICVAFGNHLRRTGSRG